MLIENYLSLRRISAYHLPDLKYVILTDRADNPRYIGIPREIGDFCRVPAMDEEKFGRPVFRLLGALLFPNFAEVPDV